MNKLEDELETALGFSDQGVVGYVMSLVDEWEDYRDNNHRESWDEYNRIWRGTWKAEDKTRSSERSRIISPATQQAVESSVAEIEEATFGRGRWFDVADDEGDKEKGDVAFLRGALDERFLRARIRKDVSTSLLSAAVWGTGIAEITVDEVGEMKPATQPMAGGTLNAIGVETTQRVLTTLETILPHNFVIDPSATSIEDAHGCASDRFVPIHKVWQLQESGVYDDTVIVGEAAQDTELEVNRDDRAWAQSGRVRLTKYHGLIPAKYLTNPTSDDEGIVEDGVAEEDGALVEAVIVIANGSTLLKASKNPNMMQDRDVIAFSWDQVPGQFWGRGVCEKAYNSQKALDAELRARIDALAMTVHPMMGVNATMIARGSDFKVRPGKNVLINGNPNEALMPFNFGNVSQITFAQAAALGNTVQTATGAIDSAGVQGAINGEATASGISMSLGAIIKRHKRTLLNFQDSFLVPFVEKSAWRYMQYDPENFPVKDYVFNTTSTLGIMAREYEVTQLVQLLQTLKPDTAAHSALTMAIVENMNIQNREEIMATLEQANQPNPEAQKMQQEQQQKQMALLDAQIQAFNSQAAKDQAQAQKYKAEADAVPKKVEIEALKEFNSEDDEQKSGEPSFQEKMALIQAHISNNKDRREEESHRLDVMSKKSEGASLGKIEQSLSSLATQFHQSDPDAEEELMGILGESE